MRIFLIVAALLGCSAKPFDAYSRALVKALTTGAKIKEVDRYLPPDDVRPRHTVRVFAMPDGKSYWYVTVGLGLNRQPGASDGGEEEFVELAAYADHKDLRIAEILSLFGEGMHGHPAGGALNAWNYDTLSPPEALYGLRSFVLRPGAKLKLQHRVSVFTVIPLSDGERAEVVNAGRERARAWVEKHAVENPAAMLARWKLTP
jgi:hypothetical protein